MTAVQTVFKNNAGISWDPFPTTKLQQSQRHHSGINGKNNTLLLNYIQASNNNFWSQTQSRDVIFSHYKIVVYRNG